VRRPFFHSRTERAVLPGDGQRSDKGVAPVRTKCDAKQVRESPGGEVIETAQPAPVGDPDPSGRDSFLLQPLQDVSAPGGTASLTGRFEADLLQEHLGEEIVAPLVEAHCQLRERRRPVRCHFNGLRRQDPAACGSLNSHSLGPQEVSQQLARKEGGILHRDPHILQRGRALGDEFLMNYKNQDGGFAL